MINREDSALSLHKKDIKYVDGGYLRIYSSYGGNNYKGPWYLNRGD